MPLIERPLHGVGSDWADKKRKRNVFFVSLCLCVSVVKISFRVLVVKTNGSVLEVADTGQDHRQTVLVGSSNDFLIPF